MLESSKAIIREVLSFIDCDTEGEVVLLQCTSVKYAVCVAYIRVVCGSSIYYRYL